MLCGSIKTMNTFPHLGTAWNREMNNGKKLGLL